MSRRRFMNVTPLRIIFLYVIIGGVWLRFSDPLLSLTLNDYRQFQSLHSLKDWAYIIFTAFIFYWLIRQAIRSLQESEEELKRQFEETQEREEYFRRIFDEVLSGIFIQDSSGHVIRANKRSCELLHIDPMNFGTPDETENRSITYFMDEREFSWGELLSLLPQKETLGKDRELEVRVGGRLSRCLYVRSDSIINSRAERVETVTTLIDRTERRLLERYSGIQREIEGRVLQNEPFPFIQQTLCELLTERIGYPLVWIGSKEKDGSVTIQAHAGALGIEHEIVRWDDSVQGQGAVGRSIRSGRAQIISLEDNKDFEVWEEFIQENQLRDVVVLPLLDQREVFGVLVLYGRGPHEFTTRRIEFLEHFSMQLALNFRYVQTRERLEEKEARYRAMFENMRNAVAVYEWTEKGEFIFKEFNPAAEQIEKLSREEVLGKNVCEVFPAAEKLGFLLALRRVWKMGKAEHLKSLYYDDGRISGWRENYLYKLPTGEVVAIYDDITARKQAEEKIWHQAHYDSLTNLPNRLLFNERLHQAIAQARRKQGKVGVFFLDLDHFKRINDTLGHSSGDRVLKEVAKRLQKCLREGDMVCRQGGDEFLILLPELIQEDDAVAVAKKIQHILAEAIPIGKKQVRITPSIGIGIYPTNGTDLETLLKQADTAMYHAKEQGRNNYQFFTTELEGN